MLLWLAFFCCVLCLRRDKPHASAVMIDQTYTLLLEGFQAAVNSKVGACMHAFASEQPIKVKEFKKKMGFSNMVTQ